MEKTLAEVAKIVDGVLTGDPTTLITGIAPIQDAKPGDITLLADRKYLQHLEKTQASCIIVPPGIETAQCATIQTANPWAAFSKLLFLFFPPRMPSPGVHESAFIGEDVQMGTEVSIGYLSYVGDGCRVADRATIFPFVYIGEGSRIGREVTIHPHVTIREDTVIGHRVIIHSGSVIGSDGFGYTTVDTSHQKIPQVGRVIIEDDVEIGANVAVDRGTIGATVIRRGSKIDNLVHIAHNVVIGENCLLVAQVGIAGSTEIGKNCVLAGQAGVIEHVRIGEGTMVGAQAGVMKSIPPHTKVSGYPARPHAQSKRAYAALSMLPELLSRVSRLERDLKKAATKNG